MIILGLETSCDETGVALLQPTTNNQQLPTFKILSNIVSSQMKIHARYGGIVPEVAARKQAENILPVLKKAFRQAGIKNPKKEIDALAVTVGPGLITSLIIGVEAAKTLAYLWQKPLLPVNHLVGHIYANFIDEIPNPKSPTCAKASAGRQIPNKFKIQNSKFKIRDLFPAICLIVSGGHTELVLMSDFEKFRKIGQTRDDAAGECFDKVAKILGLGYPGGPAIADCAAKILNPKSEIQNKFKIHLPRPMINSKDFDFSFSGLKTAVLYKVKNLRPSTRAKLGAGLVPHRNEVSGAGFKIKDLLPEFCAEVQQAIIDVLIKKTIQAAKKFKAKSIILGGGVAANQELRRQFKEKVKKEIENSKFYIPDSKFCTDNAAMIVAAGYFKLKKTPQKEWLKKFDWRKIKVDPNLSI